ncbi:PstS family phosphate ABC transporter substrate-binding protein [Hymenobacter psychrotolerans]|uniref:Phosphate transport system substrate-binding protein n=1 Tax=Hymenobacter psychrotolerans DSM 18569 TaxID=1121959 RepID=A0A1M6P0W2_9BACT|nr:substrate-binding domain-containing protein [Hymenobacter psychrotolerans]SHK01629.1 phosphate transport system substrate-binding protein [Hymenobacter psychrotolerans DSM 18569]
MTVPFANLRRPALLLALPALLLASCNRNPEANNGPDDDTPTSGRIKISVDETFAPILKSQVDTFQQLYTLAHIDAEYKAEEYVAEDLMSGKVRAIVMARPLTAPEKAKLEKQLLIPRTTHIATDGLAIILHPSNPDSLLTLAQLKAIFTGQNAEWKQVSSTNKLGTVDVVFDANRSSTTRYVQDSITRGVPLTKRVYAAKSNPALLDYVATHPNAIGIVGANWISDRDDAAVQRFLKRVTIASISKSANPASPDDYLQPYQAYLALKTYPLRRDVYIISREGRAGLGTGFASFVAGTKGQLIVLKSGLMPATGQTRIVTTSKK